MKTPKVFVAGFDCALLFEDLCGRLPVLSRLMKEGGYGALQPSDPPLAFAAWADRLSKKLPAGHFSILKEKEAGPDFYERAAFHLDAVLKQVPAEASIFVVAENIFIAKGPGIGPCEEPLENLSLMDIESAIIAGKNLLELAAEKGSAPGFTKSQEALLEERLRSLGYLG